MKLSSMGKHQIYWLLLFNHCTRCQWYDVEIFYLNNRFNVYLSLVVLVGGPSHTHLFIPQRSSFVFYMIYWTSGDFIQIYKRLNTKNLTVRIVTRPEPINDIKFNSAFHIIITNKTNVSFNFNEKKIFITHHENDAKMNYLIIPRTL